MSNRIERVTIATLAILVGWTIPAEAQKAAYLVRHAEKAGDDLNSPLTEQGTRRAQTLARLLKDAGIKAIYTSDAQRTKDTAKPLEALLGITAKPVDGGDADATFQDITTHHARDVVLVVGRSDTVPSLLKKWDSHAVTTIEPSEFDLIYVVVPIGPGDAGWSRFRYQPDAQPAVVAPRRGGSRVGPGRADPSRPGDRSAGTGVVIKGRARYEGTNGVDAARAEAPPEDGGAIQITVFDGFETTTGAADRNQEFSVPLGRASDGMLLAVYATRVAAEPPGPGGRRRPSRGGRTQRDRHPRDAFEAPYGGPTSAPSSATLTSAPRGGGAKDGGGSSGLIPIFP